jgi:antitoxin VapB
METAKVFDSGNSQAIRIPKKYKLKGKEAYITKVGDALVILPMKQKWNTLIASLNKFSDDFMNERTQLKLESREDIFK